MQSPRILITGPVGSIDDYLRAARDADWQAIPFPLIETIDVNFDLPTADARPDWIALTSSRSHGALERVISANPAWADIPIAVVGKRSAARVPSNVGAPMLVDENALALARALIEASATRVLWLCGNRSREFAEYLEQAAIRCDPIECYCTTARADAGSPPAAEAVFFTSPSAVSAWPMAPATGPRAIAIGSTTRDALEQRACEFGQIMVLDAATPAALAQCLEQLASGGT